MSDILRSVLPGPGACVVVAVRGHWQIDVVEGLRTVLVDLFHQQADLAVLDLDGLPGIAPFGVGTVVAACETLADLGTDIEVRARQDMADRLRAGGIAERCLGSPAAL